MPAWSVIIPWCNRPELAVTASRNWAVLAGRGDVEFIVVNAGGRVPLLTSLMTVAAVPVARCLDLPGAVFNRSLCINVGTLMSRGDNLVILDADMLVVGDFLDEAFRLLREKSRFLTIRRIFETQPEPEAYETDWGFLAEVVRTKALTSHDGRTAILVGRNAANTRPSHGQVLLTRRDMVRIGGMNAEINGWGFEDTDLQLRLQFGLALECFEFGELTHMTHSGAGRDFAQWRRNHDKAYASYRKGSFAGTYESDTATWRDRLVELPLAWQWTAPQA